MGMASACRGIKAKRALKTTTTQRHLKTYLISADGTHNVAFLELKPTTGGRVKIDVLEPLPGSGNGTLVLDAVLNRVPIAPLSYPITAGQTRADIRGLGPTRTLVLMDGRRLPFSDASSPAVDLNTISSLMVQQIDTVPGGV